MSVTYRIQIHNPSMNLNLASKRSRARKTVDDNELHTEPSDETKRKEQSGSVSRPPARTGDQLTGQSLKSFPLGLILQACPQIIDYGPGGAIGTWRDLMSAAIVVRTMLGVSPSAYEQACTGMGPENAATVIACILEKGGHINSAGGYLRDLTRRTEKGEFAIGPMLMALVRANAGSTRQTG